MAEHWGAALTAPDRTRFAIWAPACDRVMLEMIGEAGADAPERFALDPVGEGWHAMTLPVGAGTAYRFAVPGPDGGEVAVPDPASRAQQGDVHGWSLVVDPDGHAWQHEAWRGQPWTETILYELHVGTLGGFRGVFERLPAIAASGVTAIELMPVNAFSGTRNWGYDGVLPYAPASAYGTPEELKALVDAAHGLRLSVFLDVVYNHFGPDGNYLSAYAPDFFHPEDQTPWGPAIAFDRAPVADYFIANARMWIEEYRFDGLRFDAVHAIGDTGFLDRMAAAIRKGAGDRHVHLVLENESNDADRLADERYDAQWNDDFHNVLHVLLTGEADAYYQDFADRPAERLARCLAEGFIYQGDPSPNHDGEPRGRPSGHLAPHRFVSFLQNHDQIGNRALGERLVSLADPAALRAATGLLLLGPQIPLLFMGEETGSETPFLFFTDFHDKLADAVREGRRKEFAKFAAFADPEQRERIPDPNAQGTFDQSVPAPGPAADETTALYRRLIALRHQHILPRLDGARGGTADVLGPRAVTARWPMGDGTMLTIAINLGDAPVPFAAPAAAPFATIGDGVVGGRLAAASFLAWIGAAA